MIDIKLEDRRYLFWFISDDVEVEYYKKPGIYRQIGRNHGFNGTDKNALLDWLIDHDCLSDKEIVALKL